MEKIVENNGVSFHGECSIVRADLLGITELPENAKRVEPDELNRLLVAHSESGHHHYIDDVDDAVALYEVPGNPLMKFLEVQLDAHALLRHAKPEGDGDKHLTQKINTGLYRVGIQREHTPEGWRRVQD